MYSLKYMANNPGRAPNMTTTLHTISTYYITLGPCSSVLKIYITIIQMMDPLRIPNPYIDFTAAINYPIFLELANSDVIIADTG